MKELAIAEAEKVKCLYPQPRWYSIHRKDGVETDFSSTFVKNVPEIRYRTDGLALYFLTAGEENGNKGNLLLFGDAKVINDLGSHICHVLEGRGKIAGQRYQAKVNNLKRIDECEEMIARYFDP